MPSNSKRRPNNNNNNNNPRHHSNTQKSRPNNNNQQKSNNNNKKHKGKPVWDIEYFEEDIVQYGKKKSSLYMQYATVTDTFDDLELDSKDDRRHAKKNELRIAFLSGKEIKTHKKFLTLVDRSFCHGDVVRRCGPASVEASHNDQQSETDTPANFTAMRGTIQDIELHVDLEFLYQRKPFLKNVNSKLLRHLHLFSIGNFMMYDTRGEQWLAKIDDVLFDVVLQFLDGSVCMIKRVDEGLFHLMTTQDDSCPLFPGQVFLFDTPDTQKLLRNARFFRGAYSPSLEKGLVINVIPSEMDVDFVAWKEVYPHPPQDIDLDCCRPFTHFKYTNWTIADVGIVPDCVLQLTQEQRESGQIPDSILELSQDPLRSTESHYDLLTVNPPQALKRGELPDEYITTNFSLKVARITSTRTTVTVLWQDGTTEKVRSVDVCSLKHVDDKDFFLSDVVRTATPDEHGKRYYGVVVRVDPIEKTAQVKMLSPEKRDTIETYPIFDLEEYEELTHSIGDVVTLLQRSDDNPNHWAGEIIGIEADDLKICYSDQEVGTKKMDDVVNAGTLVFEPIDGDDTDSDLSQGDYLELANEMMDMIDHEVWENPDIVERIDEKLELSTTATSSETDVPSAVSTPAATEQATCFSPPTSAVPAPPRFELIKNIPDHRLARKSTSSQPTGKFVKTVHKEWHSLEKNLPPNIWVQASEEDISLMRACISGAAHTPYYKTIHVFDIWLPESYPAEAPKVLAQSYGLKINPNLYENGEICLSLLGTWHGKKESEGWVEGTSSIYQVLVSISGLVLNNSPYYNEAGYELSRGTEEADENSRQFNENVVLTTLSHQTALFNKPPKTVLHIVQNFLQENAKTIVQHLDELVETKEQALRLRNLTLQPSQGFLTSIKNRIPIYKKSMSNHVQMK
eukprot:CAMPEP_0117450532 /NCGR_PEP_ID=MMETSP0759-20121206/8517_1 /TAXON_ID=63605 /ORGANISM="Percolomonas cosmopolitus, Strain WS" /LENGTH=905 /DNA_ID=CAMNT_0005243057 /DNA_START=27 /DNA_END=2744 /DNA_ORIENTATION=-